MPTAKLTGRRNTLNLRIKADDRGLIDRAARLTGKTKTDFVLDAARYDGDVIRLDRSLFGTDTQSDCPFDQPDELLMRMLVSGGVRARLHSPIDHRPLFAGYDAAADLVGEPLLGR